MRTPNSFSLRALLLALVMTVSLAVPAFAAPEEVPAPSDETAQESTQPAVTETQEEQEPGEIQEGEPVPDEETPSEGETADEEPAQGEQEPTTAPPMTAPTGQGNPLPMQITIQGLYYADWAEEGLAEAAEARLIPGVFSPDMTAEMTRLQFACLAVTLYEKMTGTTAPMPEENPFTDLGLFQEGVLRAYALGITTGVTETTFEPDQGITRQQAAVMLLRTYAAVGYSISVAGITPFADDGDIADWAKDGVYFLSANGVINGVGDNRFAPTSPIQCQSGVLLSLRMWKNLW